MKLDDVKKLSSIERLFYWMQERENIRIKKEETCGASKPWTDDPILQSYRFCNVRRMDDKVSKWLLENWYSWVDPVEDLENAGQIVASVALARFVNLPESLGELQLTIPWNAEDIKAKLRARRDRGENVFNGAYVVRGNDGQDKIESVVDYYCQPLVDNCPAISTDSMQATHAALEKCYGFGSFMAGQVTADLRWVLPGSWADKDTWAPLGPGSKRGMNRLLGRELESPLKQKQFEAELTCLIDACLEEPSLKILCSKLEAMDYQSICCEFDKYERILWGQGAPKSRYHGAK